MPELPEIEVLVRHLSLALRGRRIRGVSVRRAKVLAPTSPRQFRRALRGAKFKEVSRRGKYLLFQLRPPNGGTPFAVLGHLGLTGRMFLAEKGVRRPKHAVVIIDLGSTNFIYEDPRYFGRMTLDATAITKLGPEPLEGRFSPAGLLESLKHSRQAIKVKLLDQSLVAGIGNIYASEALFCAKLSPRLAANRLTYAAVKRLWRAIRGVLREAVECGSTVPLNFGTGNTDKLFYFGRVPGAPDYYEERLRVYGRAGKPCMDCRRPIKRIVQAGRSTYYCPHCQTARD